MPPLSYHSSTQGSTHRSSYHSSTQESTHHSGRHILPPKGIDVLVDTPYSVGSALIPFVTTRSHLSTILSALGSVLDRPQPQDIYPHGFVSGSSRPASQGVTHPGISLVQARLTSEFSWDPKPVYFNLGTNSKLYEQILRDLKDAFWPFHRDRTKSLFLRAAEAANCYDRSNDVNERAAEAANCYDRSNDVNESGFELASAKAARHRLERGVWTTVRFGDMRRALADSKELRDYGALLYHCGFYEESLHYLNLYHDTEKFSFDSSSAIEEEEAVEKLIIRLNLIMSEEGWTRPSAGKYLHNSSEPW
ncbi:hypothetical protein LguiB_010714 [Lonicera macranthoides]